MADVFTLRPDPFFALFTYLIAFCSRPEAASEVISSKFVGLTVADKCVKFGDPRLSRSPEILPEAVGGGILDSF